MATILAPVDSREVVRCDRCQLTQFRTLSNLCRRCKTSLDAEEPEPAPAPPASVPEPPEDRCGLHVAAAIRILRQRGGLSQRQLALRMGVPRTYVSKIENEKATPTLSSMQRLAEALQVTIPDLLRGDARTHEDQVRELMADPFSAELIPYIGKLNGMQWTSVLSQVRDLTLHPRRTA